MKTADYLTFGNLVSGLISMFFAFNNDFKAAAFFILLGVAFDYADGKVARILKQQSELGVQLDSFADAITFGVAIAFALFVKYHIKYFEIILLLFVCSGVYRLARYNVTSGKKLKATKTFEGTPITLNGVLFPFLLFFNVNFYIVLVIVIILSYTMVSKIKIPHL